MPNSQTENCNELWTYIAGLRPKLRSDVRLLVHAYRGQYWYVLQDESSGRFIRFNQSAYRLLGKLDGEHSVSELLELANSGIQPESYLTPEDVIYIMAKLDFAEVLRGGMPPSTKSLLSRFNQSAHQKQRLTLSNPLAIRIPLFDPDRLLNRLTPLARLIFSQIGKVVWLLVALAAVLLGFTHFNELADDVANKQLATTDLLLLFVIYPVVKAFHELGHGLAVKAWGGEVHETGITLLVFMPVPYIDGSAAWAFSDKRKRALVSAAGILAELFLAGLGIIVWVTVEPGLIRDIALNVALICSISTLLFNANPLLRFDGYQVLSDLIEIPNLFRRSGQYYLYLMQRYALGLKDIRSPVNAVGERMWFAVYGLASPAYRLLILVTIAFYLVNEFFVVGVVLACWAVMMQVIKPIFNCLIFLATSPRVEARRIRGFAILSISVLAIALTLLIPMPLTTNVEGVVWMDDKAQIVAANDGFVAEVLVPSGEPVIGNTPLIRMEDERLTAKFNSLQADLEELQVVYGTALQINKLRVAMVSEDIAALSAQIQQARIQLHDLLIHSRAPGQFIIADDARELIGRYFKKGDVLGYVLDNRQPRVRVVIEQDRIDLVRSRRPSAKILLAHQLSVPLIGTLLQEVPAASTKLPSLALGAAGGGAISVDMNDKTGYTSTDNVFQLDLALPVDTVTAGIGARVYVRLHHGKEALWLQLKRNVQQLFLSRLNV